MLKRAMIGVVLGAGAVVLVAGAMPQGSGSAPATTAAAPRKLFFDSTQYAPVTVKSKLGLPSCQTTNGAIGGTTDKQTTQWYALRWARDGVDAIAVDIEEFSFDVRYKPAEECKRNAEICAQRLRWIKEAAPNVKVGMFGYPFCYPVVQVVNLEAAAKGWKAYKEAGDFAKPLIGPWIDFCAPEIYSHDVMDQEHDPNGVILQAQRMWIMVTVAECRRLFPDKPVYPFLSPAYVIGGDNKKVGENMPGEAFAGLLEACGLYADGAMVWGGWGKSGRLNFNAEEPWAKALKAAAGK